MQPRKEDRRGSLQGVAVLVEPEGHRLEGGRLLIGVVRKMRCPPSHGAIGAPATDAGVREERDTEHGARNRDGDG